MDLLVIGSIICAAWTAVAFAAVVLCRVAAQIDADIDRIAADVLRSRDHGQDGWRAATLS